MKLKVNCNMLRGAISVSKDCSYYPEFARKKFIVRLFDNLRWVFKYKEYNRFYNLYGLDLKRVKRIFDTNYCDYDLNFRLIRDELNNPNSPNSQVYLLRDKFQFWKYLESYGLKSPRVFAIIIDGKIYDTNLQERSINWICNFNDFFVKDNNGECGSYVKYFHSGKDFAQENNYLSSGTFICQERVKQAEQLSKLYSNSVNTIRIVTVRVNNDVHILSAILRVGTSGSNNVDNWAKGGLVIGITSEGKLQEFGYYKPHKGTKVKFHPDTGEKFDGLQIPYFDLIKATVIQAHKLFYGIHSIGWDVCVGEDGPILIEGNDNWEISLMQAACEGLKKEWMSLVKSKK